MPLVGTQITWHYSVGGRRRCRRRPDPNQSFGGHRSSTEWANAGALFDVITGDENTALDVEYRLVVIRQPVAAQTAFTPRIYIGSQDAGGADIAIGLSTTGVVTDTALAATRVADEGTVPTGVSFSAPTTKAGGLVVPTDMGANTQIGLWIRRTAMNSAAMNSDDFELRFAFDSGE